MINVLGIRKGNTVIAARKFPDRKKPCLTIERGNEARVYAKFENEEDANEFIMKLMEFFNIEIEERT